LALVQAIAGGHPRYVHQFFNLIEILELPRAPQKKAALELGMQEHCPCNDAPNPEAYRVWISQCIREKVDPTSDRSCDIANEIAEKYKML